VEITAAHQVEVSNLKGKKGREVINLEEKSKKDPKLIILILLCYNFYSISKIQ
jgi:hypothetical protein